MNGAAQGLTVGIGGLGAIGLKVARALDAGIPGLRLGAVSARDAAGAARRMEGFTTPAPVVALSDLAAMADVVIECAPAAAFASVADPAVEAGRILMPLSCGVLLRRMDLVERARQTGARIIVPTGALVGFDAVRAAAEGVVHSVTMETRKPPKGLVGAPYLTENGIDVGNLSAPLKVFEGNARDAAKGFPANVNVAAALSLAGIGPDRTMVAIWADPTVDRNTHRIRVDADSTRFEMLIEGIPSPENPATGMLTPLSVIATLRALVSPLRVGS
ncbi:MAG: aspartate dehydrogenase [Alphaproteobacteria bacterium]